MKTIRMILLLLCVATSASADESECFVYDTEGTTITALTEYGTSIVTTLTIPSHITNVASNAFSYANATALVISDANVNFEAGAFTDMTSTFTSVNMGKNMSNANMASLITALNGHYDEEGGTIEIEGLDGCGGDVNLSSVLRNKTDMQIVMPAQLVREPDYQNFNFGEFDGTEYDGNGASIYGRFLMPNNLASFTGSASFQDKDNGSQCLFYIPTEVRTIDENKHIYIQRVLYVRKGMGVVIQKVESSAEVVDLLRVNSTYSTADDIYYAKTMMIGCETATDITPTTGDKTNLGLGSDGAFHPLNVGTIPANKAYLQILTTEWQSIASSRLGIAFPEEEMPTEISVVPLDRPTLQQPVYNLAGQRVGDSYKGYVIVKGKKVKK